MVVGPETNSSEGDDATAADPEVIWRALLRANLLLGREIEGRLEAAGQPPLLWLEVTGTLGRLPDGRLRQRELAGLVAISPSGLSRLLDRMEGAGLIRRRASQGDRRGADVILTEAGRKSTDQARPLIRSVLEEHLLGPLGSSGEEVRAGLRRIVSSLS